MKKKIFIFGLGFVGYPLMLLLANNKKKGKSIYEITGVETNNNKKNFLYSCVKKGLPPFSSSDKKLNKLAKSNLSKKINIIEKKDIKKLSGVVLVCINFDGYNKIKDLKKFFTFLSKKIEANTKIIIESTLLPGTSEKILYPILKYQFKKRNLDIEKLTFGYSYERIMPGSNYLNSITDNYKSISGINRTSINYILKFYKSFINYKKFPITIFKKITECETAKIMENSYRAANISFIDEWNKFSYKNQLNLKKIISSIKLRDTHSNIMRPGIGVGGYCLTKDPSFGLISSQKILKNKINFPVSNLALKINDQMPNFCFKFITKIIKKNDKILMIGSAYKSDISDQRLSPSLNLFKKFKRGNFNITVIDPLVNKKYFQSIYPKKLKNFNVVIFSVPHSYFKKKIFHNSFNSKIKIFDLDYVLNEKQLSKLKSKKIKTFSLGDFSE